MAIFGDFFCVLYLQRAACSTFQTCILSIRTRATTCVEVHVWHTSDLRPLRLGQEKKKKIEGRKEGKGKKLQGKNIMAPLLHRAAIITRLTVAVCLGTHCNIGSKTALRVMLNREGKHEEDVKVGCCLQSLQWRHHCRRIMNNVVGDNL